MPDVVDLLDVRGAVRNARAQQQRVHGTPALVDRRVDARLLGQVDADRLDARVRHRCDVHDHDFGAQVQRQRRRGRAHPGRAADDDDPPVVEPQRVEQ
jgi:hypothetical protein